MRPPENLIQVLNSARRPVVVGHVNPDVDALGAMLALARAMPTPDAAIVLPDTALNQKLQFLLDLSGSVPIADGGRIAGADTVIVLDTAGTNRVSSAGTWAALADKFVVNIDHHITNADFGRINWVVAGASSTCELVYCLIAAASWPLDAVTASLLYAGVYADTAAFSLPNAGGETFDAAAALVRAGADVERVGTRLCRSQEQQEFDLIRTVYHNTRLAADGRIAYSTLTHDEIIAAGCTPQDIDDQVSIPRSLSGIKIAILFSEGEPGLIRINLRGEAGTAILPLARELGGGGHTFSAGVRIRGDMDTVVNRVLNEAVSELADRTG